MLKSEINPSTLVRLDKWLWVARFYKTRSIARNMLEGGKIHYNGQRTKPSKIVEINAVITLMQGHSKRTITVLKLAQQRKSADEAKAFYQETSESIILREKIALARKMNALTMPHPDRRPNKKERRQLMQFKQDKK